MPTVDFTGMDITRVIGVLRSRHCTGELTVVSTYRQVKFKFEAGTVTSIHSDRPADRLGLQMMKAGDIGVIDLHGALVEQHQQRLKAIASESQTSRLGEILVDQNVLNSDELAEALDRYMQTMAEALSKDVILDIYFDGAETGEIRAENAVSAD